MKPKKLLSFILATAMTISLLPTFTPTASAGETQTTTEKNITLKTAALSGYDSTNNKYKYIYYGTYNTAPIKQRILTMNGNEGTYYESAPYTPTTLPTDLVDGKVYTDSDETTKFIYLAKSGEYYKQTTATPIFLLSEYALKQMAYELAWPKDDGDGQTKPSDWRYSDAWYWCNNTDDDSSFISSSFTDSEKAYLLKTSKANSYTQDYTDELKGDTFFFLSKSELESDYMRSNEATKLLSDSGDAAQWWLRAPNDGSDYNVLCVNFIGKPLGRNVFGTPDFSARPAFNLNSESVLFTSAADGKKTDNVGTLSANGTNTSDEYKLTMTDENRKFAVTETSAKGTKGETITFNYSNAETGSNEYISAMIVKDGEVLYYGQGEKTEALINDDGTVNGTVKFTLPDDIAIGEYTLYIFNEQINGTNGNYAADFSSAFQTVTLNVAASTHSSGGGSLISRYTVKFDTDGGSTIESQTVTQKGKATEPTEPTKEGYIFDGWYTDSKFEAEYDFNTKVTRNITLYAKWTEDEVQEPSDDKKDDNTGDEPQTGEWKNPFTDIKENDWFFDNVKYANQNGLMSGITNTTFAPNDSLTRAMLVTVLWRAEGEPVVNYAMPFADIDENAYYAEALRWAASENIVSGITETEFAPDMNITREQTAAIIYRYAKYKGVAPTGAWAIKLDYADAGEISDYAVEGVMYCTMKNIMQGKDNNMFAPKDNATRAETAAILGRFIENNK